VNQQTLIQELEEVFNKIAEIIQGNDLGYAGGQRRANFKSASLLCSCDPTKSRFLASWDASISGAVVLRS
jgi:hypothetical protein